MNTSMDRKKVDFAPGHLSMDNDRASGDDITEYIDEEVPSTYQSRSGQEEHMMTALQFLSGLDDDDYVICIDAIVRDCNHLQLENRVMNEFLKFYEPQMIHDLPKVVKMIDELEHETPLMPPILEIPQAPNTPLQVLFSDQGARLNVSTRQDLLVRYSEDMEARLTKFVKKMNRDKFKLHANIEESSIRLDEIQEARTMFEESMQAAVDPITQRIPAEKFIWFLTEWLKSARQITEKFRLRNLSLKGAYTKAAAMFEQKLELGETLHAVDFEQYIIENVTLVEKINLSNMHLKDLKHFNGEANLNLATAKIYLQRLLIIIRGLKKDIAKSANEAANFKKEVEKTVKSSLETKAALDQVKALVETCHAPDTLEYLRVKARFSELIKVKKILERKENLQNITVDANKKMMMNLTGQKKFDKHWFDACTREAWAAEEHIDEQRQVQLQPVASSSSTDGGEFDIFKVIKLTSQGDSFKPRKISNKYRKSILK